MSDAIRGLSKEEKIMALWSASLVNNYRTRLKSAEDLLKAKRGDANLGRILVVGAWAAWLIALVIFSIKISNTSDFALQFSTHTQEIVGNWVIGLGLGFLLCVLASLQTIAEKEAYEILSREWIVKVRDELGQVSASLGAGAGAGAGEDTSRLVTRKVQLESVLRQLDAG
jgi:hypothetical protein